MLMCHHVYPEILPIINQFNDVSFDDGLYSVYKYRHQIISKNKILFITPKLLNITNTEQICCSARDAMSFHFIHHSNIPFLSIPQLHELYNLGFKIGYHGFTHDVIIHGYNKEQNTRKSWRFYKYPELKGKERYYKIDSCLSNAGYQLKNGVIRFDDFIYHERVHQEISNMVSFFSVYDIPVSPYFAPPFNSLSSYLESILREYIPNVQIFSDERKDICEIVSTYYDWKGEKA